ncbi:sulfate reduction electron transfer complex DsrMKJOP subunit DsrJ [Desulfopila aestuarii]|uniref:Putative sulfite reductase-associated electron transfer protein DsrJ n=1 Tax=Desulfopila aestuarii DSM 18488 TaxID=1121416 RepID=A0A1M7YAP2_9BACT|nr:sulfate reduction electron transfer complex DsrMKJOP subunit DsrJ [Desulfopila aestuarii]SHO49704.1 putative sulfite reductase-associated electron transfer protein DsrJ [Desulfopila aestuarii DSM 18488]
MYNKRTVIPGLAIFVLFVTLPLWYNGLSAGPIPKPELPPNGTKECVAPASEMRDNHMVLLNEWRDSVLRESGRSSVSVGGKEYPKALQLACMECHSNKEKFCDDCHTYASVKPYCWDCHLTPVEAASKKETH